MPIARSSSMISGRTLATARDVEFKATWISSRRPSLMRTPQRSLNYLFQNPLRMMRRGAGVEHDRERLEAISESMAGRLTGAFSSTRFLLVDLLGDFHYGVVDVIADPPEDRQSIGHPVRELFYECAANSGSIMAAGLVGVADRDGQRGSRDGSALADADDPRKSATPADSGPTTM